jgi:hypothetical protein
MPTIELTRALRAAETGGAHIRQWSLRRAAQAVRGQGNPGRTCLIADVPIPTTFLVDSHGVVKWIDQAEDYMWRSDPERLLSAIEENL